ncbi:MAG: amidohydrolase [Methanomicrobiales archaeon]|nr:amidohydrolase [Methanomicrobiales archaeon]MDI6877487.1 amidohydrolase [Methanomicrobiales archaeon]
MSEERSDIFEARGSILLERVSLDGRTVDIAIDDSGTIAGIGEDLRREYAPEFILDGEGNLIFPGFVNTHTHAAMTLLRGYADDLPLHTWLSEKIWPLEAGLTGEDVYWGTRLACLEMIRSGTIAFSDMYFHMPEAARAVTECGMKAVLAYGFIDLFEADRREREIRATEEFARRIETLRNPNIRAAVGPHAVYTVSREGLEWLAEFAAERDLGIHVHLSETEKEVQDSLRTFGVRPPRRLDDCGLLTPRTVAAHCNWVSRSDCALLAARGVHVAMNPASNMKLAVNRAPPYPWFREFGIPVTLGTDGAASNNSLDLIQEMKFAALLQKFYWNSQTLLPAGEAVEMASSAGMRALRLGSGRIEPGAPADIVLIRRRAVCTTPLHSATSNLVYACSGSAVDTAICGGRVLMFDRIVPGEEETLEGAARAAERLVSRTGG